MKKRARTSSGILLFIFIFSVLMPFSVSAQSTPGVQTVGPTSGSPTGGTPSSFQPIVGAPWFTKNNETIGGLLNSAFTLAIGIGSILAVLMLTIGGFQYMTQDAIGGKKDARARIQGAIFGLILLLLVYLILFVINPDILKSIDAFESKLGGLKTQPK